MPSPTQGPLAGILPYLPPFGKTDLPSNPTIISAISLLLVGMCGAIAFTIIAQRKASAVDVCDYFLVAAEYLVYFPLSLPLAKIFGVPLCKILGEDIPSKHITRVAPRLPEACLHPLAHQLSRNAERLPDGIKGLPVHILEVHL